MFPSTIYVTILADKCLKMKLLIDIYKYMQNYNWRFERPENRLALWQFISNSDWYMIHFPIINGAPHPILAKNPFDGQDSLCFLLTRNSDMYTHSHSEFAQSILLWNSTYLSHLPSPSFSQLFTHQTRKCFDKSFVN